jgi:Tfp pilus assembly protein PilP
MKLTTGILAMAMMVGGAWAQNPDAIDTARSTAKSLQQKQANDTNPAPAVAVPAKGKPAPGAPAPAVKPAVIPSSKPAPMAKPASAPKPVPAATPDQASAQHNQLKRVNVIPGADSVQIEITSAQPVTPKLSRLKSPDRVLVELPETVLASSQSKIPVGSAGVKGVRIGMDGKTPPTTSVVIDLEKPLAFELTPGSAGKVILTLHSEGVAPSVAKTVPAAPVKAVAVAPATAVKAAPGTAVKAAIPAPQPAVAKPGAAPKVAVVKAPAKPDVPVNKPDAKVQAKASPVTKIAAPATPAPVAVAVKASAAVAPKPKEEKKWAMTGKRDPFFSPVVQQNGSGCSTGKKCLEIGAINLRGVVKSDSGFIAVVTNNLNKAYFLRENDPVFNGYVVKITGDSVVFQETIQDKLGKSFTREVVKRIFTPAV